MAAAARCLVLASLGAVDGPFAWPGFAARIVVELWQGGGAGGGLAVRLVYNGEDATHKLACAGGRAWCSLDGFAAQVAALIAPHATWEAACAPAPEAVSVSVSAVATAAP